jgi:hypothetical protein
MNPEKWMNRQWFRLLVFYWRSWMNPGRNPWNRGRLEKLIVAQLMIISWLHYRVRKSPAPDCASSQFNQHHTLKHYSFKVHFNTIFLSTPASPKWYSFFEVFRLKSCMHFTSPRCFLHAPPIVLVNLITLIIRERSANYETRQVISY